MSANCRYETPQVHSGQEPARAPTPGQYPSPRRRRTPSTISTTSSISGARRSQTPRRRNPRRLSAQVCVGNRKGPHGDGSRTTTRTAVLLPSSSAELQISAFHPLTRVSVRLCAVMTVSRVLTPEPIDPSLPRRRSPSIISTNPSNVRLCCPSLSAASGSL